MSKDSPLEADCKAIESTGERDLDERSKVRRWLDGVKEKGGLVVAPSPTTRNPNRAE